MRIHAPRCDDLVTVRAYCLSLLQGPSLADKLRPPRRTDGSPLDDGDPGAPLVLDGPARDAAIAMTGGADKLPKLGALKDPAARAACLARFAHHELQAVELFAWALLAFPAMPAGLRRGLLHALAEEQVHLQLYLDRLAAHGARLSDAPLSDYFWKHTRAILQSEDPVLAFLCAMGLTLEAANLDFTLLYRDAFRAAGDEETAVVLQRVHDDEIGHVRLAATWAVRLAGGTSDLDAYQRFVPFPFSAARAKARRFDRAARTKAGLSDELIAFVADARPYGR